MIYLDNIIFSLQRHGGVSVLWGNLINALLNEEFDTKYLEYKDSNLNKVRSSILIPEYKIQISHRPILIERFKNVHIDTNISTILHSSHYRISKNPNIHNITTVHDFTYEYFFSGLSKRVHCWQKYKAINFSDTIICISENTKRDLLKFLPDINEKRIKVVYNGVAPEYRPLNDSQKEDYNNYLLFVGGRQSYKNFRFAVACAKEIGKKLLIAGSPLNSEEKKLLNNELGLTGYEIVIHPTNNELNLLYNSVGCLIYPSLYEGFGIPVVEAQKAGCPVIAMNSSSIPEIISNKVLLLNSVDTSNFKQAYFNMELNRQELLLEGLENAKRFSWNKMTKDYINIYKEILQ